MHSKRRTGRQVAVLLLLPVLPVLLRLRSRPRTPCGMLGVRPWSGWMHCSRPCCPYQVRSEHGM